MGALGRERSVMRHDAKPTRRAMACAALAGCLALASSCATLVGDFSLAGAGGTSTASSSSGSFDATSSTSASSLSSTSASSSASTSASSSSGLGGAASASSSSSAAASSSTGTICAQPCAGGFICLNGSCLLSCGGDTDCAASTDYCDDAGPNGTCVARGGAGSACSSNDACMSMICGTTGTGFCCVAACTTGGACGATGCSSTDGTCVYPSSSTACAAEACSGDMITPPASCDGMGACGTPTAAPCPGNLVCQDAASCYTACGAATRPDR